jgi:hypothetical protein
MSGKNMKNTSVSLELCFFDQKIDSTLLSTSSSTLLAEVSEMRGRVWYDDGNRPSFRKLDGNFEDFDTIDLRAFHIIARSVGHVVGCARVAPLASVHHGVVSSSIGEARLASLLQSKKVNANRVCEASRWAVLPEFRGELGARLVAATWAVARWLFMEMAFVMAGTRRKQDVALVRMGAQPITEFPLVSSQLFNDELRLLCFDVLHPPESMRRHIDEAAAAMHLSCTVPGEAA